MPPHQPGPHRQLVRRPVPGLLPPRAEALPLAALAGDPSSRLTLAGREGLWHQEADAWHRDPDAPTDIRGLCSSGGALWALTSSAVWRRQGRWQQVAALPRGAGAAACPYLEDGLLIAGTERLWLWQAGTFQPFPAPAAGIRDLAVLDGDHCAAVLEDSLLLFTLAGTAVWLGAEQGLPAAGLTCIARAADGSLWLGSQEGLIRWREGRWSYLAGPRWLPDNRVTSLAKDARGEVLVRTGTGLTWLQERELTLETKAAELQQELESRNRRQGFVTVMQLPAPGQREGARQEISDNDGLWTALYVASQCFRFAVTGAAEARQQAWRSLEALLRLEPATGIPGFPARALAHVDEPGYEERSHGEWHPCPHNPGWMWKGDTSSDELDGHYFALYVAYELAADAGERERLRSACRRLTDHILEHGYYLVDLDGQPTRWGVWAPERLNHDPAWAGERGLNSLEILSHLAVAHHLTGEARYHEAYRELIEKHGYAINNLGVKVTTPGHVNHSDDELAFLAYYPLLRLETEPGRRALYLASLRANWEFERVEACPLWNFIWGACSGEPCDVEAAVRALQEMPLDLINWPVRNSHRLDLRRDPVPDRFGKPQLLQPLPWSERPLHKWNGNPFLLDGGDGREEEDQTVYLLPYWLGRYHGLIG